ncbi:hypothetical protein GcC1_197038 [Golovinomyces cichoracearum]|uniref:Uncharacterized protein n=1 Tax=Golovinomyces cichoracearum TaxID=62708 RepID=A0A420HFT1_9PEZI|nr:hypothetical protein GcC1_197038 [Golovinomyces cichoracearum]
MNVVAKTKKHFKSQDDFDEFYSAWLKVLDSQSLGAYNDNLRDLKPLHTNAVKYVVNTWLVWREKIVKYWVDKAAHFGNTTTSRNESSHAAIKAYLRNKGTGDHKHFFDTIRDPSLFEHVADFELPPSTAPPRIEGDGPVAVAAKRGRGRPPKAKITAQAPQVTIPAITLGSLTRGVSTTVLGFQRGAGTILDPYDAGTLRERAYLRSVHIEKLGSATVPVIEEGSIDIDDLEKSQGGETYTNGSEGEGAVCTSRAIQP